MLESKFAKRANLTPDSKYRHFRANIMLQNKKSFGKYYLWRIVWACREACRDSDWLNRLASSLLMALNFWSGGHEFEIRITGVDRNGELTEGRRTLGVTLITSSLFFTLFERIIVWGRIYEVKDSGNLYLLPYKQIEWCVQDVRVVERYYAVITSFFLPSI